MENLKKELVSEILTTLFAGDYLDMPSTHSSNYNERLNLLEESLEETVNDVFGRIQISFKEPKRE